MGLLVHPALKLIGIHPQIDMQPRHEATVSLSRVPNRTHGGRLAIVRMVIGLVFGLATQIECDSVALCKFCHFVDLLMATLCEQT